MLTEVVVPFLNGVHVRVFYVSIRVDPLADDSFGVSNNLVTGRGSCRSGLGVWQHCAHLGPEPELEKGSQSRKAARYSPRAAGNFLRADACWVLLPYYAVTY